MGEDLNFVGIVRAQEELEVIGHVRAPNAPTLSVITPAFNESMNLPVLYERLCSVLEDMNWEWLVIDDHSTDDTFTVVSAMARRDPRVRVVRFARNSGSHTAVSFGLNQARGEAAVVLASDLQDPPEAVPTLLDRWKNGFQVVWAVRRRREGESLSTIGFSRLYYFLMRKVGGTADLPATGADFFLLDRRVIDAYCEFNERNASVMALLTWMGFRQTFVTYDKQARLHGKSGWTLKKKLKLVADSLTAFSFVPIRLMSYAGFGVAFLGFCYAAFVFLHAIRGNAIPGWSSLMVIVLVIGGLQMLMLGVLGEYLWRALDESRQRPRFLLEDAVGFETTPSSQSTEVAQGHARAR